MATSKRKSRAKSARALEIDEAWAMDEDELLLRVGLAAAGTETLSETNASYTKMASLAAHPNGQMAMASLDNWLLSKGRKAIKKLWREIKKLICDAYKEGIKVKGDKDIVGYLVGLVTASGKLSGSLAVFVVTWVVKKRLAKMCGT